MWRLNEEWRFDEVPEWGFYEDWGISWGSGMRIKWRLNGKTIGSILLPPVCSSQLLITGASPITPSTELSSTAVPSCASVNWPGLPSNRNPTTHKTLGYTYNIIYIYTVTYLYTFIHLFVHRSIHACMYKYKYIIYIHHITLHHITLHYITYIHAHTHTHLSPHL